MQARLSIPALALALVGCMKPNPLVYTLGDDSETATGSETADDDDDDDGGSSAAESTLPDLANAEVCAPLDLSDPFEPACSECLALDCCDLVLACAGVDECLCLAGCRIEGGSPGSCKNACGGVSPGDVDELEPLLACATTACDQAC
jgi:hypothetical protein